MSLKDKVIIVTGGKRGIGKAISILLAREGANLVICARNQDGLETLKEQLSFINKDIKVFCKAVDVRMPEQVNLFIDEVKQNFGRIDVLINNAAIISHGLLHETNNFNWDIVIETNLKGPFLCMKHVIPHMKDQQSGHIINIGSISTKLGFAVFSLYCASKFGLRGMSIALREELRADNIQVSIINPGCVDTEMWEQIPGEHNLELMMKPEDIAQAVLYILNNANNSTIDELDITSKQFIPIPHIV